MHREINNRQTEKDFQEQVRQLALLCGFEHIFHTWDSRHSPAGFPDLIILKDGRMIVAELKREGEQPSAEQYFWLLEFSKIPGAEVYLWRPSDWDSIAEILRHGNV